jgi:hypothetical protein
MSASHIAMTFAAIATGGGLLVVLFGRSLSRTLPRELFFGCLCGSRGHCPEKCGRSANMDEMAGYFHSLE